MAVKILSCMTVGLEGRLVEVEVDIMRGLSSFHIVGLGDTAIKEAKQRLRSALKNSGFAYPQQKKVINLAPAHLRKQGPQFDVPMAIGLLGASGQIPMNILKKILMVGELALDGSIRPVRGVLTMALFAKQSGYSALVIPAQNSSEASLVKNFRCLPARSLTELIGILKGTLPLPAPGNAFAQNFQPTAPEEGKDFLHIKGQEVAKRVLMISAAGHHHCLLFGPPGVGKTMLAQAMATILPPLSEQEIFEITQIYSCAGRLLEESKPLTQRPFREIHPNTSLAALLGGGAFAKPGELSLAHRGVLFLDEIGEFPRVHLESLRIPLESKDILLGRHRQATRYPANFLLLAGMNPCPCGYRGDSGKACLCTSGQISRYEKKLSGPILDRLDLMIEVGRPPLAALTAEAGNTSSAQLRAQVFQARRIQLERFKSTAVKTNSEMRGPELKKYCQLEPESQNFLQEISEKIRISGRNYHQILKIARTVADLNAHENIQMEDLGEALQYRQRL